MRHGLRHRFIRYAEADTQIHSVCMRWDVPLFCSARCCGRSEVIKATWCRSTAFPEKREPFRERGPQHSVSTIGLGPCASQPEGPFYSKTALESPGVEDVLEAVGVVAHLPPPQRPRRRQRKPSSRPATDSMQRPPQQPATRTPSRGWSRDAACALAGRRRQETGWRWFSWPAPHLAQSGGFRIESKRDTIFVERTSTNLTQRQSPAQFLRSQCAFRMPDRIVTARQG
jgi:hypothetical protein